MNSWIAVASAEHVQRGKKLGIMQVCHGKRSPLLRISPNDKVIYYSPTVTFKGNDKLHAFTAIGEVKDRLPYQVEMESGFCPFRRDVTWYDANSTPIWPLLDQLDFTKNKKNWGYQFRFGLFKISLHDLQCIARAMNVILANNKEN